MWRRGNGTEPTDRAKTGWKWSVATDANGIPIGWVSDGANRNDCVLLPATLDDVNERGLLSDIETLHLDRGYDNAIVRAECERRGVTDYVIAEKRARGTAKNKTARRVGLGQRWPVERTNSWFSNYGQLRRNTDRFTVHRLAQLALAITLLITVKLVKWAKRWNG